jgi:hypothetical protein
VNVDTCSLRNFGTFIPQNVEIRIFGECIHTTKVRGLPTMGTHSSHCFIAIPSLHAYPKPIQSYEEAKSLRGVGQETAKKVLDVT